MQGIEREVKNALTNLPPLTQHPIIAEVRPERDLAGAFSFRAPSRTAPPILIFPARTSGCGR